MAFEPVNELERLLVAAAQDPAARSAFYRALREQDLFVITDQMPEGERQFIAGENASIKIRMIEFDGTLHAPIFTSVERISAVVAAEVGFVAMKGHAVFTMLRGSDLVLNPGAQYGKVFTKHEVESLIDGSLFAPTKRNDIGGKKILLGQPKNYPHHITAALSRLFAKVREIKAAYLAHAFVADIDSEAHTLIGLEVDKDFERVLGDAGVVVREVANKGEIVDFVQVRRGTNEFVSNYMTRETKPFYARKKWFGLF